MKLFQLLLKKWSTLKELVILLRIPYDVTVAFQNKKLTLSDVYGKWLGMQLHLEVCTSKKSFKTGLANHLLKALRIRNEKIFNNPLMACALYLDPRFQLEVTKNREMAQLAKDNLLKIWRRLNVLRGDASIQTREPNNASKESLSLSFEFNVEEALAAHFQMQNYSKQTPFEQTHDDIEILIDLFQPEPINSNRSVVEYWESIKDENVQLYQLTTVIFCIPPTEVQIERDFSALDFIFTKRRGNLESSRLEEIFVIHLNKDLFYAVNDDDVNLLFEQLEDF